MKKVFLFIVLAALFISVTGESKNTTTNNEVIDYQAQTSKTKKGKKDTRYWKKMAEGMSRALTTRFWGANFKEYPERYYFNYGSDLSNMTTNHYWPQAHAMDVVVDAYLRTSDKYYLNFYPLWWTGAPKFNFSGKPEDRWWNVFVDDMELSLIHI